MDNDLITTAMSSSAKNIKLVELERNAEPGKPVFGNNMELIQGVRVNLSASVGKCELTVAKLFALQEGTVLSLDRATDEPVEIYLDSKLVARGELVVVGDNFGIRIVELGQALAR